MLLALLLLLALALLPCLCRPCPRPPIGMRFLLYFPSFSSALHHLPNHGKPVDTDASLSARLGAVLDKARKAVEARIKQPLPPDFVVVRKMWPARQQQQQPEDVA